MKRIVITPRSLTDPSHPELEKLKSAGYRLVMPSPGRRPQEEELKHALDGAVGYLAGVEPVPRSVLEHATQLRVISRNGVGTDNIDLQAARELGITIRTTPGANARGVAELAFGMILAAARRIPFHDRIVKGGQWMRVRGSELEGKSLGVVGCGRIGKLVTTLALAAGMRVHAYDPEPDHSFMPSEGFSFESFDHVIGASDVLTLHCQPPADGAPLLDRRAIATMRHGVLVVNTARGALVDDDAVEWGLAEGIIGAYATDVFTEEPPENRRLAEHPQVITTPHIGGYTAESVDRATKAAVANLMEVLDTDRHAGGRYA